MFISSGMDKVGDTVDDTSMTKPFLYILTWAVLKGLTLRKCVSDLCVCLFCFIFV